MATISIGAACRIGLQGHTEVRRRFSQRGAVLHRVLEAWDGNGRDRLPVLVAETCEAVASNESIDLAALRDESTAVLDAFLDSPLAERLRRFLIAEARTG